MKTKYSIYKTLIAAVILMLTAASCDDNLDLAPEQDLAPETATSTPRGIQSLLLGVYDLAGADLFMGGDLQLAAELLPNDGELAWRGTFSQPAEFNRKQMTTQNTFVRDYWIQGYAVTNQANLILENLEVITDSADLARTEGEAKFLRGIALFELVRMYGLQYEAGQQNSQPGVPIVLESVTDPRQITFPPRSTVEEVYTQIISDLQQAVDLLPEDNNEFADKYSAQALLARVFLQQGNYAAARDAADDVINNSGHTLAGSFEDAFNNDGDSVEDVFAWQITSQDGINDLNLFWSTRDFGGRSSTGDVTIEDPYFDLFNDANDERGTFFYAGNGTTLTLKWQSQFANIPYIRLAEMHLIRAEANFTEGSSVGASPQEDINALRARSNASPLGGLSLQDILDERKRELGFEGFILHDLRRTASNIAGLPYNANSLVMPIPQREMDANPNLQQNPGYVN